MTDAARTGYGTQVHLVDAEGRSRCGIAPSRLSPMGDTPWANVPGHERCHTCEMNETAPRQRNGPPWWQGGTGVDRAAWDRQRVPFPEMAVPPALGERLRISDLATYLGVSRQRVQQIGRAGHLPAAQAVDGIGPWWRPEVIERWAVEQWWGKYRWRTGGERGTNVGP